MEFECFPYRESTIYSYDKELDNRAVNDTVTAMDQSIRYLKDVLRRNDTHTNAGTKQLLCRLGQLLDMRNRLAGTHHNIEYLYSDDGEFFRYVAGFLGDSAQVEDAQGMPLHVGDTVVNDVCGKQEERMVILNPDGTSILPQTWIDSHNAVFQEDFQTADILTANRNPANTVSRRSCLEDYYETRKRKARFQTRKDAVER